jgi:hypothetical protein
MLFITKNLPVSPIDLSQHYRLEHRSVRHGWNFFLRSVNHKAKTQTESAIHRRRLLLLPRRKTCFKPRNGSAPGGKFVCA